MVKFSFYCAVEVRLLDHLRISEDWRSVIVAELSSYFASLITEEKSSKRYVVCWLRKVLSDPS